MEYIEGRKVIETLIVQGLRGTCDVYSFLPGKLISIPSRKGVKKAFGRKQILVNGDYVRSSFKIKEDDYIQVLEYTNTVKKEYSFPVEVCYEDDYVAVVVKPPGMPTSGNKLKTLQNALPGSINKSTQPDALGVPLTVHRLDAKTHGLVIIAKTARARIQLGEDFENRKVKKTYVVIVQGKLAGSGTIDQPIDGKEAVTNYVSVDYFASVKDGFNSVVELEPITGRKHQLRIHLAELGHPIVGDVKYSEPNDVLRGKGMFLSSNSIQFKHPITSERIKIEIDLPPKFERYKSRIKRWNDRIK